MRLQWPALNTWAPFIIISLIFTTLSGLYMVRALLLGSPTPFHDAVQCL